MNIVERLNQLTDIQLAAFLAGESILPLENLRWISKNDVLNLLKVRTDNFNREKVDSLLEIFNKEKIIHECTKIKHEVCSKYIISGRMTELDDVAEEYLSSKNAIELFIYAVDVLGERQRTQTNNTTNIKPANGLKYLLTFPGANELLNFCIEHKLLDCNYQPIVPYVTTYNDRAYLADEIVNRLNMPQSGKWQCFAHLWGMTEKQLADAKDGARNKKGSYTHQQEIDGIFKKLIE